MPMEDTEIVSGRRPLGLALRHNLIIIFPKYLQLPNSLNVSTREMMNNGFKLRY